MHPILEIKNATVYQGDTLVFKDLNLTIDDQYNTVILGPNGAGKSTLLKLLTRETYPVKKPDTQINILGEKQWNIWDLRAHMGILSSHLQSEYLLNAPARNVILSGFYSSNDVKTHHHFSKKQQLRVDELIAFLDIAPLLDRVFGELSTGEQRKLLFARALVHKPKLMVLDEPTSGLDISACFEYIKIIQRLIKSGTKILLITHHLHEIPPEIERVILLKKGEIVQDGLKESILTTDNLAYIFGTSLRLTEIEGFYHVSPTK